MIVLIKPQIMVSCYKHDLQGPVPKSTTLGSCLEALFGHVQLHVETAALVERESLLKFSIDLLPNSMPQHAATKIFHRQKTNKSDLRIHASIWE